METYGDYIKVEESEKFCGNPERRRTASDLIKDSITYGNIGKAEDLMKDQVMRKVDEYLPLVRRKKKEAQEVLQVEQAANPLMGRIEAVSEAEPLSEDKFISEILKQLHGNTYKNFYSMEVCE